MRPVSTGQLRYALLQGNDKDRYLTEQEIDEQYLTNSHFALASRLRGPFDLIVFPESSLDTDPRVDPALAARIATLAAADDSAVLVNTTADGPRPNTLRNVNLLYGPDGTLEGTYDKQHLVPFGEYVPWRPLFGWVSELRMVPEDMVPGRSDVLFRVAGHPVGTVICFESAFGPLVRSFVRDGAELIVVSTNNRSYRTSANSAQHVALSQMRAAETARPVLHASISGITAVIDASGKVESRTRLFHNAVVTGTVTTERGQTPFVRYGDWIVWLSALGLGVGALTAGLRRRRSRRLR